MEKWLSEKRGKNKIEIKIPKRGELAKLRRMADQNAEINVLRHRKTSSGSWNKMQQTIVQNYCN